MQKYSLLLGTHHMVFFCQQNGSISVMTRGVTSSSRCYQTPVQKGGKTLLQIWEGNSLVQVGVYSHNSGFCPANCLLGHALSYSLLCVTVQFVKSTILLKNQFLHYFQVCKTAQKNKHLEPSYIKNIIIILSLYFLHIFDKQLIKVQFTEIRIV